MNPWLSLWIKPRETIRGIVTKNANFRLYALSGIYGLPILLHMAQSMSLSEKMEWPFILLGGILLSVLAGFIGISISAALFYWTGKWLGGKAPYNQVRAAVAWSNATSVANIAIWLALMAVFGARMFMNSFPDATVMGMEMTILQLLVFAQVVISVWSFVIFLHMLGEVQKFSAWKSLLNCLVLFVLFAVALWLLGLLSRS